VKIITAPAATLRQCHTDFGADEVIIPEYEGGLMTAE